MTAPQMKESSQAATRCPLCEGENQCAIAAGQPAESCWCQSVTINVAARTQAADFADARCLCPACGAPTVKGETSKTEAVNAR